MDVSVSGPLAYFAPCPGVLGLFLLPWCRERPQITRYFPRRKAKQSTNTTLHLFKTDNLFVKIQKESVVN